MRQNISKAFRTPFGLTDLCRVLFPYRAQLRPGFKCKPVEGSCRLPHALSTCLLLSYDSFLWEAWSDLPYFLDSWILNEAICFFHHPDEFCVIKRNWRFCVWKVLCEILGICEYELLDPIYVVFHFYQSWLFYIPFFLQQDEMNAVHFVGGIFFAHFFGTNISIFISKNVEISTFEETIRGFNGKRGDTNLCTLDFKGERADMRT